MKTNETLIEEIDSSFSQLAFEIIMSEPDYKKEIQYNNLYNEKEFRNYMKNKGFVIKTSFSNTTRIFLDEFYVGKEISQRVIYILRKSYLKTLRIYMNQRIIKRRYLE